MDTTLQHASLQPVEIIHPQYAADKIAEVTQRLLQLDSNDLETLKDVTNKSWFSGFEHSRATFNAIAQLGESCNYDLAHDIQHLTESTPALAEIDPNNIAILAAIDYLSASLAKSYGGIGNRFSEEEHDRLVTPWLAVN